MVQPSIIAGATLITVPSVSQTLDRFRVALFQVREVASDDTVEARASSMRCGTISTVSSLALNNATKWLMRSRQPVSSDVCSDRP
jgi:hypothetical protein